MINKKGETRPMVDLTGKFYLLNELDENFVKECVDVDKYKEYQGAWVKNAYDPQFMVDGKYDEKAAQAAESLDIVIAMMMTGTLAVLVIGVLHCLSGVQKIIRMRYVSNL